MPELALGRLDELKEYDCREFSIGAGDWPFRGFVVRKGNQVFAYENVCRHVGHPLNLTPDKFLSRDGQSIVCASHGALYEIDSGVCFAGPCQGKALQKVACEIRDGVIYVTARA
ncbi:MAG TPA: Rieske 2Fe-2S domain-containing protein [Woeseiaceae bacterium]|nr:Rieske 2Fe-2S domain-containing protein [Woeseiaceae bacterium]